MSSAFSPEELAAIKTEAAKLQSQIAPVINEDAIADKLRAQIKAELEADAKVKEDALIAQKALEESEARTKAQSEQLASLQQKIDSLTTTRGVTVNENPFKSGGADMDSQLNNPDFVKRVDKASMDAWFSSRHRG